jgi:hypothetical protein
MENAKMMGKENLNTSFSRHAIQTYSQKSLMMVNKLGVLTALNLLGLVHSYHDLPVHDVHFIDICFAAVQERLD